MTAAELEIKGKERRRCVGMILAAYSAAVDRGDKITAEVLDALATRMEHEP